jgi:TonB family protein
MSLDLENYHPEVPRVPTAISVREGVLLSLVAHLVFALAYVLMPKREPKVIPIDPDQPVEFVQMAPIIAEPTKPRMTPDTVRKPANDAPLAHGDTPEKVLGAPAETAKGQESPVPDPPAAQPAQPSVTPITPDPSAASRAAGGNLGLALRNLNKYLRDETFDNPQGGQTNKGSDIQFDDKGIDFGPWLARFKREVESKWYPPQTLAKGHVVFQFWVLRNGTIIDIRMVQPSEVEAYNLSARSALNLSMAPPLPKDYPDDKILFTVTFHYNEGIR